MPSKGSKVEYKEPKEHLTKFGYASSILNGNTVEGGLKSITYKSIYALKLVEESELVKHSIVSSDTELLSLLEKSVDVGRIAKLRSELENLKSTTPTRDTINDQLIEALNSKLDEQLLQSKSITQEYQDEVLGNCRDVITDNSVTFKKFISNEPVATMEEVEGFDGTMYHRAAERRREEERLENERFALEAQKLEEEAMLDELNMRQVQDQMKSEQSQDSYNIQLGGSARQVDQFPSHPAPSNSSFDSNRGPVAPSYSSSYSTTPGI